MPTILSRLRGLVAPVALDEPLRKADGGGGGGAASPLTTKGDIWSYSTADGRFPVGADGLELVADSSSPFGLAWSARSPLTTKGDLWGFSTGDTRVPIGSDGFVLTADAAQARGLKWAAGGPLTTKGDLYGYGSAAARLPVGTDGYLLLADSTQTLGVKWAPGLNAQSAQAARVYRTTNQAIANATLTAFSPDTLDFDAGSPTAFWAAGAPTKLTAPQAGKYVVGCSILWDASTTGNRSVYVVKNGVTATRLAGEQMPANNAGVLNLSATLNLASGDYVEFYVNQNSGGSVNVAGTEQISSMWIALVGVIYVPRIPCGCTWTRRGSILQVPAVNGLYYVPRKSVIKGVSVLTQGSTAGSCKIDIWKAAIGSFPPTVANSIVASAFPQIIIGKTYSDTVLTGWTTALAAGDCLIFNLVSNSLFTEVACFLWLEESS